MQRAPRPLPAAADGRYVTTRLVADGGSPFTLDMANRPILWSFTSPDYSTWHPRISLRGHWQYPVLVMDDGGSLSREFGPDGHLYSGSEKHPEPRETVSVTLKEASMSEFDAACAAIAR